jgi:hypothetical protein
MLRALLADGTQTVEVQPVIDNLVAGELCNLPREVLDERHRRIDDLPAAQADKVRVRVGPAAVVAIVVVAEAKLQHFAKLLQQGEGLVDRRPARGRELGLDLLEQVGRAGMSLGRGNETKQRNPLRSQAVVALLQLGSQLAVSGLRVGNGVLYHRRIIVCGTSVSTDYDNKSHRVCQTDTVPTLARLW